MKINQIATPLHQVFASYAVQNKKKAWIVETQPVLFFGLIPSGQSESSVEALVYNYNKPGISVATAYDNFLGLDIITKPNQPPKDFNKELIAYIALVEKRAAEPIVQPPAGGQESTGNKV